MFDKGSFVICDARLNSDDVNVLKLKLEETL
jgi:hypothetical protein